VQYDEAWAYGNRGACALVSNPGGTPSAGSSSGGSGGGHANGNGASAGSGPTDGAGDAEHGAADGATASAGDKPPAATTGAGEAAAAPADAPADAVPLASAPSPSRLGSFVSPFEAAGAGCCGNLPYLSTCCPCYMLHELLKACT